MSSTDLAVRFAPGALTQNATTVRVRSTSLTRPNIREVTMAVLAEGVQWEVRVSGGGFSGVWHLDVPPECQSLPPAERMAAVDKIMRRVAGEVSERSAAPAISNRRPLAIGNHT